MGRVSLSMTLVAAILWIAPPPSTAQLRADGQSEQAPICIPIPEAFAHFVAGQRLIHSTVPELSRVTMKLVVAPNGTVGSATPVSGNTQWYEKATALALDWHFAPFQREGAAIYAKFEYSVRIVPPEKRPEQSTPFPEVSDWDSVRITLQRTACRGLCPAYKLTIFGDGRVLFRGYTADYGGEYHGRVSHEVVRQLVDLFRSADYFNLFDRYGRAFDGSDFITSLSFDGYSKSVFDESGLHAGMPDIVSSVEDGIDRLAGPRTWAKEAKAHH
jgi:hypothetical protein